MIMNATSSTNAHSGQGLYILVYDMKSSLCPFTCRPTRLSHDILQMRLNCLRAERRQLGYLLFVTSHVRSFVWGGDYQDGPVACRETYDMVLYVLNLDPHGLEPP